MDIREIKLREIADELAARIERMIENGPKQPANAGPNPEPVRFDYYSFHRLPL